MLTSYPPMLTFMGKKTDKRLPSGSQPGVAPVARKPVFVGAGSELKSDVLHRSKSSGNLYQDSDVNTDLKNRSASMGHLRNAELAYGSWERFEKFKRLIDTDTLDVTEEQREIFGELKENRNFEHFVSSRDWHEIPDYMNSLILVKKQIQDKNPEYPFSGMNDYLAHQRKVETENHIHAEAIRNAILKGEKNDWSVKLRNADVNPGILTKIDREIKEFTPKVQDRDAFLLTVVNNLVAVKNEMKTKKIGNVTVKEYFDKLPKSWYGSSPWYNVYADKFKRDDGETGFNVLSKALKHIQGLGCNNLYILPHFESPGGDGGYDISDYSPAKKLGGEEGFKTFLSKMLKKGMTLTTDLVIGHVSAEHEWFKKAINGDPKYYNYFLKAPAHWPKDYDEKTNVVLNDEGDRYQLVFNDRGKNGEMVKTKRDIAFYDFTKTTWLNTSVKGLDKKVPMYHTFYPFQIDLNVFNPNVLDELLKITGKELLSGAAGCRVDAPQLTVKNIGGGNNLEPESKNFYNMINFFRTACHENSLTIPEFPFFDHTRANLQTDQAVGIKMASVIGDYPAFFRKFGSDLDMRKKNEDISIIVPNESHDENQTTLDKESGVKYFKKIETRPGTIIYMNGKSVAGRVQDQLGGKEENIINQNTIINFLPGVPCYFYGTELGIKSDFERLKNRQHEMFEITNRLLGPAGLSKPLEDCLDPRELQRAEIPLSEVENKKDASTVKILQELAETRSSHPVMNSRHCREVKVSSPDNTDVGRIFAIAKLPESPEHKNYLVNLTNTSPELKNVYFDLKKSIPELGDWKLDINVEKVLTPSGDKLDVKKSHPFVAAKSGQVKLQLEPYQAIIFDVKKQKPIF